MKVVPGLLPAAAILMCAACVSVRTSVAARDLGRDDVDAAGALAPRLDSLRLALRIPGLAVVLLRDTTILLARGFGVADVERQVAVTPETPFNIASVAKPISAVVALRLVQDGLLDLDRPMRRYAGFAEFCDAARGDGGIFFGDYACTGDGLTLRHVLGMTANGEVAGARFWYNPPSYSWASRPMAEVAGRAFSELVDSLVFRPAGMRNSARTNRRLPLPPRIADVLATPYHTDSAGRMTKSEPPPPQGDGAAGGVIASAMDIARFDIALTNGRLLAPASRAALWSPTRTPSGRDIPYGLGWFLGTYEGRRVAWHTGLWEGRYSALYLKVLGDSPAERLTLVLLANSDGLQWEAQLDEAAIERSPFATAFLSGFPTRSSLERTPTPAALLARAWSMALPSDDRPVALGAGELPTTSRALGAHGALEAAQGSRPPLTATIAAGHHIRAFPDAVEVDITLRELRVRRHDEPQHSVAATAAQQRGTLEKAGAPVASGAALPWRVTTPAWRDRD